MQLATQREVDGGLRSWTIRAWRDRRSRLPIDDPTAASEARRLSCGSEARQKLLAFASLILLLIFFSFASPAFMQTDNMINILQATAVNGVLAIAGTFVIITAGIDLSVGTLMTFCAVMAGVFLTYWGLPMWIGVVAAIATGALSGVDLRHLDRED